MYLSGIQKLGVIPLYNKAKLHPGLLDLPSCCFILHTDTTGCSSNGAVVTRRTCTSLDKCEDSQVQILVGAFFWLHVCMHVRNFSLEEEMELERRMLLLLGMFDLIQSATSRVNKAN
jgi:hypothetical protein